MVNTLRQVDHFTGTTGTTSNSAQTYTLPTTLLNVDRAFVIIHFRHAQIANHDSTWHAWAITSTTELTIWNGSGTVSINFEAYIIEFDAASDIRVQIGTLGDTNAATPAILNNSTTPATNTLSPAVNLSETMSYLTGHQQTGIDTTIGQEEYTRTRLLTTTTWEHAVIVNPNSAQPVNRLCVADWNDANVSVQRGQNSIGATATSDTLVGGGTDFNTVDFTRTIILVEPLNAEANFSQPMDEGMIQVAISGNDLVITRQAQGGFVLDYNWQLIEFPSGFLTVEHLIHTMPGSTSSNSDTISTLTDFNNAFVMSHTNNGGFGWDGARPSVTDATSGANSRYQFTMDLSSNTNVNFDRGLGTTAMTIGYQVIEFLTVAEVDIDHTTDVLVQETFDLTHTTDILVQETKDLTHTTDIYLVEVTNLIHTTDILIQEAVDKTYLTDVLVKELNIDLIHTTDILILETFSSVHTTDILVQVIDNDLVHTTDILISGVEQHTTDILIQEAFELIHTTDIFIVGAGQVTHSTDILIQEIDIDRTHTTDVLIQVVDNDLTHTTDILISGVQIHTTDILVQKAFDISHTTDILIQAAIDVSHTTDILIQEAFDISHVTDVLVKAADTIIHTTDVLVKATQQDVIHTTDVLIKAADTVDFTTDVLVKVGINIIHTTDVFVIGTTISHTTDVFVQVTGVVEVEHSTDVLIQETFTRVHSTDILVQEIIDVTHTTDIYLVAVTNLTHTTDILIQDTFNLIHTTDVLVKEIDVTITHSTDILIQESKDVTHSTDILIKEAFDLPHTTDILVQTLSNIIHTTDVLVSVEFDLTQTSDVLVQVSQTVVHTSDLLVKAEISIIHSTDVDIFTGTEEREHSTDVFVKIPFLDRNLDVYIRDKDGDVFIPDRELDFIIKVK